MILYSGKCSEWPGIKEIRVEAGNGEIEETRVKAVKSNVFL